MRELKTLTAFSRTAQAFWEANVLPPDPERVILVELMGQDLRVAVRSLTIANALRRIEPARIVVYGGADEEWNEAVWTYYDLQELGRFARGYGADEVVDVHALVDARIAGTAVGSTFAGVDVGGELPEPAIDQGSWSAPSMPRSQGSRGCRGSTAPRSCSAGGHVRSAGPRSSPRSTRR